MVRFVLWLIPTSCLHGAALLGGLAGVLILIRLPESLFSSLASLAHFYSPDRGSSTPCSCFFLYASLSCTYYLSSTWPASTELCTSWGSEFCHGLFRGTLRKQFPAGCL